VVAPFDHTLPLGAEEVNTTEPPEQNEVGPFALIVGIVAPEVIVKTVKLVVLLQVPFVTRTE